MPLGVCVQDHLLLIFNLLTLPSEELIKAHQRPDLDACALFREIFIVQPPPVHFLKQLTLIGTCLLKTSHGFGKGNLCLLLLHARYLEQGLELKSKFFHDAASAAAGSASDATGTALPTAERRRFSVSS